MAWPEIKEGSAQPQAAFPSLTPRLNFPRRCLG